MIDGDPLLAEAIAEAKAWCERTGRPRWLGRGRTGRLSSAADAAQLAVIEVVVVPAWEKGPDRRRARVLRISPWPGADGDRGAPLAR